MESCFSSRQQVNNYLIWAIRMINSPVSTIAKTLLEDEGLRNIVEEKSKNTQDFYTRFFSGVRNNKESGDNLGEEMLAVCLHVLVKLPEEEGKFCVITDDKGAAGKIDASFRRVNRRYREKRVFCSALLNWYRHYIMKESQQKQRNYCQYCMPATMESSKSLELKSTI